ncbi:MAG: hypothetical protein KAX65_09200, partial [Caldilineaceae bacterium]|nr:hypothetical protein [Caldilineaceae bacterium]
MDKVLVTNGSAFVTAHGGGTRWSIGSGALSKTVEWRPGAGLFLAALENQASDHLWRAGAHLHEGAGGEFLLCWEGATYSARQATALHRVN